jgi:hypothetical protein
VLNAKLPKGYNQNNAFLLHVILLLVNALMHIAYFFMTCEGPTLGYNLEDMHIRSNRYLNYDWEALPVISRCEADSDS